MTEKDIERIKEKVALFNAANISNLDAESVIEACKSLIAVSDDEALFKIGLQEFYKKTIASLYGTMVQKEIKGSFKEKYEHQDMPTKDRRDIVGTTTFNAEGLIPSFDALIASSVYLAISSTENANKDILKGENIILGGLKLDELKEDLRNSVPVKTPIEELREQNLSLRQLRDEAKTLAQFIRNSSGDERIHTVHANLYTTKASACYALLRQEHRSHSFLWRWFTRDGAKSRQALQDVKSKIVDACCWNPKKATNLMLGFAQDTQWCMAKELARGGVALLERYGTLDELNAMRDNPNASSNYMTMISNDKAIGGEAFETKEELIKNEGIDLGTVAEGFEDFKREMDIHLTSDLDNKDILSDVHPVDEGPNTRIISPNVQRTLENPYEDLDIDSKDDDLEEFIDDLKSDVKAFEEPTRN